MKKDNKPTDANQNFFTSSEDKNKIDENSWFLISNKNKIKRKRKKQISLSYFKYSF